MTRLIEQPERWVPGFTEDRQGFRFLHNAHRFTLFKRGGSPYWQVKFKDAGRQVLASLKTTDAKAAKLRAIAHYDRVKSGAWTQVKAQRAEETLARKQAAVTLGQILDRYEEGIRMVNTEIDPRTVQCNAWALRRFVRVARAMQGAKEDMEEGVRALALAELAPGDVDAFKLRYLAPAGADKRAQESRRRGGNSVMRQAGAVFSQAAMKLYKALPMPDLEEFLEALRDGGFTVKRALVMEIPREAMEAMTAAAWRELRAGTGPLWLAHLCYKHLGMRNVEIAAARWSWLQARDGMGGWMVIDQTPEYDPKGSLGRVPVSGDVLAEFERLRPADGAAHLVDADHATHRYEIVYRQHSEFVKRFLDGSSKKTSYRLRKWAGDRIRMKYNDDASKAFLRHADDSVAAEHYWSAYNWAELAALRGQSAGSVGITLLDAGWRPL